MTARLARRVAVLGLAALAVGHDAVAGLELAFNRLSDVGSSPVLLASTNNAGAARGRLLEFAVTDARPLARGLLATVDGYYGPADRIACSESTTTTNSGHVSVLLAISKCLNDSSLELIESWVTKVKLDTESYFAGGASNDSDDESPRTKIEFATTVVPGQCAARTEREVTGRAPVEGTDPQDPRLLATDVAAHDLARFRSRFDRISRVLDGLPGDADTPVAVIAFVGDETAYEVVTQYERRRRITNTFNFQLCHSGVGCAGAPFEDCLQLREDVELFMYNPFTVRRSFECPGLEGGVPVTYLDDDDDDTGNNDDVPKHPAPAPRRRCFCTCPAGSVEREAYGRRVCEEAAPETCPCTWSTHPFGFKHANDKRLGQCRFGRIASDWAVPVPFPYDNYVADLRVNNRDPDAPGAAATADVDPDELLRNGPHVDVAVTPTRGPVYDGLEINQLYKFTSGGAYVEGEAALPPRREDLLNSLSVGEFGPVYDPEAATTSSSAPEREVRHYTWREYQTHRVEAIDELEFEAYGKYALEVVASDYVGEAACAGCVAIVDHFRPRPTQACPVGFCENTTAAGGCHGGPDAVPTAELTMDTLKRADELVRGVYAFQATAENDACSDAPENRCDDEAFAVRDFFDDAFNPQTDFAAGRSCFDARTALAAFFTKDEARANPLVAHHRRRHRQQALPQRPRASQHDTPVRPGQCTRCCRYGVALREFWTDFTCGYDYDVSQCSGRPDARCDAGQCLVLRGDGLATARAEIRTEVRDESARVLAGLTDAGGFQTATQIHRALQCSAYGGNDGACTFEATVAELVGTSATLNVPAPAGTRPEDFVHWRYRLSDDGDSGRGPGKHKAPADGDAGLHRPAGSIDAEVAEVAAEVQAAYDEAEEEDEGGWFLLPPTTTTADGRRHVFRRAETKLTLEAWTQCGLVRRFFFYVHLHTHSPVRVCDHFGAMWYQTSVSRLPIGRQLCAVPRSDFAELTFDYHPNIGLGHDRRHLQLGVSAVVCRLQYAGRGAAEVLRVERDGPEIVERLAVELVHRDATADVTEFTAACDFTYTRHDRSTVTHTCAKGFAAADCSPPAMDPPDAACAFDDCAARGLPGPYEACGGRIVSATAAQTHVRDGDGQCCQSCGHVVDCAPLLGLPNPKRDLARCVPRVDPAYAYGPQYGDDQAYADPAGPEEADEATTFLASGRALLARHGLTATSGALGLVAVAALVVVAMVAVRNRRHRLREDDVMGPDDVYHPLLH